MLRLGPVVAAIQFGDPAHVYPEPYDKGTSTSNGTFAREDTTALDQWSSVLASVCDSSDLFCDSGSSVSTHEQEVQTSTEAAVAFVVALVSIASKKI